MNESICLTPLVIESALVFRPVQSLGQFSSCMLGVYVRVNEMRFDIFNMHSLSFPACACVNSGQIFLTGMYFRQYRQAVQCMSIVRSDYLDQTKTSSLDRADWWSKSPARRATEEKHSARTCYRDTCFVSRLVPDDLVQHLACMRVLGMLASQRPCRGAKVATATH